MLLRESTLSTSTRDYAVIAENKASKRGRRLSRRPRHSLLYQRTTDVPGIKGVPFRLRLCPSNTDPTSITSAPTSVGGGIITELTDEVGADGKSEDQVHSLSAATHEI
ncbi:hypothetical protein BTUL_0064g00190 [Botrytis tulipae]|uniref:Uncharacterized protein n=1 Tax=Botrytis tulipae TaxID=87230 RepID=A0A4Z1EY57_9HELO|nr:hypothetical protein BTUL_0064g00190 [Botrytis tulipae]